MCRLQRVARRLHRLQQSGGELLPVVLIVELLDFQAQALESERSSAFEDQIRTPLLLELTRVLAGLQNGNACREEQRTSEAECHDEGERPAQQLKVLALLGDMRSSIALTSESIANF